MSDSIALEFQKTRAALKLQQDGVPYSQAASALEQMSPEEIKGLADGTVSFTPGAQKKGKGLSEVATNANRGNEKRLQDELRADREKTEGMEGRVVNFLRKEAKLDRNQPANIYRDVMQQQPSRANAIFESLLRGDVKYVTQQDFDTEDYASYKVLDPE